MRRWRVAALRGGGHLHGEAGQLLPERGTQGVARVRDAAVVAFADAARIRRVDENAAQGCSNELGCWSLPGVLIPCCGQVGGEGGDVGKDRCGGKPMYGS